MEIEEFDMLTCGMMVGVWRCNDNFYKLYLFQHMQQCCGENGNNIL